MTTLLPAHFPDHLAAMHGAEASPPPQVGANVGSTTSPRYATLALLVLLCLVPRALMAWKIGGICPDAVVYIQVAEFFDKGMLNEGGLHRFGLNLYPVVLMLLHGRGWTGSGRQDLECLDLLPDRVAALRLGTAAVRRPRGLDTGCLYAFHAELIRSSPEGSAIPRLVLHGVSLYLLGGPYRSPSPFFLLGGLTMPMATMTRSEGLFLLVPLLLWSFCAELVPLTRSVMKHVAAPRRRLPMGVMLAVAVFPRCCSPGRPVLVPRSFALGNVPYQAA